jgi:hypothetical protein
VPPRGATLYWRYSTTRVDLEEGIVMSVKGDVSKAPSGTPEPTSGRRFRFPSAFTVLFFVTVAVWLMAFIIPTGRYAVDEAS